MTDKQSGFLLACGNNNNLEIIKFLVELDPR